MLTSISMADVIDPDTAVLHIPKMIRQDEYGYRTSNDGKDISPLTVIPLDTAFPTSKASGPASVSFVLKRFAEGYYVCSCPAWKFSTERDKMRKTCSHLKDCLGERYETERIALAKEAKSTGFDNARLRRTTSDGYHARHTHAKSVLNDHFRQLSHSQPEISLSDISKGFSGDEIRNDQGRPSIDTPSRDFPASPTQARPTHVQNELNSDTETEDEEVVASQANQSRPSGPTSARSTTPISKTHVGNNRRAYNDHDDDEYGFDPEDVQMSPSKRARRGNRSNYNSDDEKVRERDFIFFFFPIAFVSRLTLFSLRSSRSLYS